MVEITTDCRDPSVRCRTLPPLRNGHGRKKKPSRLHPLSPARNNDTADPQQSSVALSAIPQLTPLQRMTPEQEEIVHVATSSSDRPRSEMTELGIQTDDNFDEEIAILVEHLVTSAILRARESLEREYEIARLRRQAQNYKQLFNKLEHSTKLTIEEKNKVIENMQREEVLRLTRSLAEETCKQITGTSLARLENMEKTELKTRSIGLDTRSIRGHLTDLQIMTAEVEEDFIPWMFVKADQIFRRAMTTAQLENMLIRRSTFRRVKFENI